MEIGPTGSVVTLHVLGINEVLGLVSRFRVSGFGFGFFGEAIGVWSSGLRFRVSSFGFRGSGFGRDRKNGSTNWTRHSTGAIPTAVLRRVFRHCL